jgi:D-serine deaminase-like pyridoxal phosphate-dependent protein
MPVLLLDQQKCLHNIEKMASRAARHKLILRPHCKTHQSVEIGNWFRDFGVSSITVSSFHMAQYFAEAGWKDILVAFPFHPGEIEPLKLLSEKCNLSILVDTSAALPFLHHIPNLVGLYIDIDTGYGRTGVKADNPELIEQIILKAGSNPKLEFRGFYCHAGNSYKAANRKELDVIHLTALKDLGLLKQQFKSLGPQLLFGDTPNCSSQEKFGEIDEITPGNFVFYDLIQAALGSCSMDEIAVAMECQVAGRYPEDERIVIHGGAIHFSKEFLMKKDISVFGQLVQRTERGWMKAEENIYISNVSQEHGVLEQCGELVREINIGESLLFLPVHSCLTANLMRTYRTLDGRQIDTLNSS